MPAALRGMMIVALGAAVARADVTTTLTGSKLVVSGDGSGQTLVIESTGDGVTVRGLAGTLVDGSAEPVTVPGVLRLSVKLHEGADRLTVTDVSLPDGIDLRLGDGNDDVLLDRVRTGAARIRSGNGYDAVQIFGPSTLNQLSISTSSGRDLVVLDDVWVPGDLHVDTGTAPDDVSIALTDVGDDIDVRLGNDDDVLVLADVAIYDDTDLDGENGDDVLVFYGYIWFEDDLDVDGFNDDWWW